MFFFYDNCLAAEKPEFVVDPRGYVGGSLHPEVPAKSEWLMGKGETKCSQYQHRAVKACILDQIFIKEAYSGKI